MIRKFLLASALLIPITTGFSQTPQVPASAPAPDPLEQRLDRIEARIVCIEGKIDKVLGHNEIKSISESLIITTIAEYNAKNDFLGAVRNADESKLKIVEYVILNSGEISSLPWSLADQWMSELKFSPATQEAYKTWKATKINKKK